MLGHPRWEDFEYEMMDRDMFSFMGNGMTESDLNMAGDFAPYMDLQREWPELREFFEQEKQDEKVDAVMNGVSGGHGVDNLIHRPTNGVEVVPMKEAMATDM